ncbi:MAG: endoribonuclease MazF [Litorimonas sp.]
MAYIPEAGDVVWLSFDPQSGHEQAGHRPALVLSPASYNRTGLMLCCPMTTRVKGYPFEVPIAPEGTNDPPNVVLSDQVKSLDWRARRARRKGRVADAELAAVRARAMALIRGS